MSGKLMGLTAEDMDSLCMLAEHAPPSMEAAARLIGTSRPQVHRLIRRIEAYIGVPVPNWRQDGRFALPPEARRLAREFREHRARVEETGAFPRISGGTLARVLAHSVLTEIGLRAVESRGLRTRDVIPALKDDEIDLALVHGSALDLPVAVQRDEYDAGISVAPLLNWRAALVMPAKGECGRLLPLRWSKDSHANNLTAKARAQAEILKQEPTGPFAETYLFALECVRRDLPYVFVMPDIYVSDADVGRLRVRPLDIQDTLVAVFRTNDEVRLGEVLDPGHWTRAAPNAGPTP